MAPSWIAVMLPRISDVVMLVVIETPWLTVGCTINVNSSCTVPALPLAWMPKVFSDPVAELSVPDSKPPPVSR